MNRDLKGRSAALWPSLLKPYSAPGSRPREPKNVLETRVGGVRPWDGWDRNWHPWPQAIPRTRAELLQQLVGRPCWSRDHDQVPEPLILTSQGPGKRIQMGAICYCGRSSQGSSLPLALRVLSHSQAYLLREEQEHLTCRIYVYKHISIDKHTYNALYSSCILDKSIHTYP